jgi:1-aminocyclopropane-1-carboxylate deaminase/D-cysteine desulfhydrase-like pyridoxal-dependent ACC family enzyme
MQLPSPLVELRDERLGSIRVLLKRDDLIHPEITGNKWRKLKYLLPEVQAAGAATVLTFGGAYSNHLGAVAALARTVGLGSIGVVRGEERPFNEVLAGAVADGMRLHYLDRATYRRKDDPAVVADLRARLGDFYLVPEGGTTIHALRGCAETVEEIREPFDVIVTAVGTGGTLAGLATGLRARQRAVGISVLKGATDLEDTVAGLHHAGLGRQLRNWTIDHRFHHGGFARRSPELDRFSREFSDRHGWRPDHVYVGKMLFALFAMAASGEFSAGTTVVAVVTGAGTSSSSR